LVGMGLTFSLLLAEGLLQVAPSLLPISFRERFPPHGIEFFHPGILDRTPITAVPLPYAVEPYDGPPPHDIADFGIATSAGVEADLLDVPRLVLPADADGLPNRTRPEDPDLVLVGDSFAVFASQEEPAGLQQTLERDHGVSCLNLGISGIGPDQELWLLKNVGLPTKPRVVVWFLFGGNDFTDAFFLRYNQALGSETYGQLHAHRRAPRLLVPNLIASWFTDPPKRRGADDVKTLAPLVLRDHPDTHTWFYPDVLRVLALPTSMLTELPPWQDFVDLFKQAHTAVEAAGAKMLVVYLPSKEQIYLPQVRPEAKLLHDYAVQATLYGLPMSKDPDEFLAALLANCTDFEEAMRSYCAGEGIAFWSATPALTKASLGGDHLYYRTDTHWRAEGQRVIVPGLQGQLEQLGVTKK
jgi:hypothetical protein